MLVLGRAVPAQQSPQSPQRDSTASDSTARASSSVVSRWLHLDHFGVALGPSVNVRRPGWTGRDEVSPGIAGGFFRGAGIGRRGRPGLIPALKFDIFPKRVSVVDTANGSANALSTIKMRSLMGGLGWSQPVGQSASVVITGVAGRAFNGVAAATGKPRGTPFDVASSPAAIQNSLGWEVSGRLWHRLRPATVILAGVSYYRTRPRLTFADGTQRESNFDNVRADVGIAFTLYRR